MPEHGREIAVIGGGVIGCSIAYHLARRGARVVLIERDTIGAQASGATAGGVRQNGRDPREMPLAIAAIKRWHTLETELDADCEFRMGGQLLVTEDPALIPEIRQLVASQQALGLDLRMVEGAELRELSPGLAPSITAGLYTSDDGQASGLLTTRAFAAAAERLGVRVLTGTAVTGIAHTNGRISGIETTAGPISCDHLVLAAGAWSARLTATFGLHLPLETMALQMMSTGPAAPMLKQTVGALNRRLSLKQIPDGSFVIGGGWPGDADLDTGIGTTRMESIRDSMTDAIAVFPALAALPLARVWIGIEALAPDAVPILGPVAGIDNLTIATGFSGHGFALSPIIGQLLAEQIIDGEPSISIDNFALHRFSPQSVDDTFPDHQAG